MAAYALIGGRDPLNLKNFSLEERIFSKLQIRPKRILFIPHASLDIDSAVKKFRKLLPKEYSLAVLENLKHAEEAFKTYDVIYFGGGSTKHLLKQVKDSGLDKLLDAYKNSDKVFIGISAGAILFTKWGCGDQYIYKTGNHTYNYQMVEGLGILSITFCPHYDHDGMECYNDFVKAYPYDGYALEDDTALLFSDDIYAFKLLKYKSIYTFSVKDKYLMLPIYEEKL